MEVSAAPRADTRAFASSEVSKKSVLWYFASTSLSTHSSLIFSAEKGGKQEWGTARHPARNFSKNARTALALIIFIAHENLVFMTRYVLY